LLAKMFRHSDLGFLVPARHFKYLILFDLSVWLAALDDFRNWLIREAA